MQVNGTKTISRFLIILLVFLVVVAVCPKPVDAADQIGQILFTKGVVSARGLDGASRLVGKDAPVYEGDVLITGQSSFAVFETTDGTRVTVRPDTVFGLESYAHGQGKESAIMRLAKGGIRAVSGMITKLNQESGLRLHTPTAVVAVRGTQFDARLCEGDACNKDSPPSAKSGGPPGIQAVGRVFQLQGRISALGKDGGERDLPKDGPVFVGDILETGKDSNAVVVFRDDSRVSLPPGSRFAVENYNYQGDLSLGDAFFRLLKGGMRVLSGAIVKLNPQAMKIGVPTAVLALRGTAVDMRVCQGDCPGESGQVQTAPAAARIVQLQGEVTALAGDGRQTRLGSDDPVRVGTTLTTAANGSAVVVFRDNSRVTLQPNTQFKVEDYRYSTGGDGSLILRLVKGSMRAVSGWMSRRNPDAFRVHTPTCVLAVRGTGFDIIDPSSFTDTQLRAMGIDPATIEPGQGAIFFLREGGPLDMTNASGTFTLQPGQAAFFPSVGAAGFALPAITDALTGNPFPAPESIPADIGELFKGSDTEASGRIYVSVRDGNVVVIAEGGAEQVIPPGVTALLAGWNAGIQLLPQTPPLMLNIPAPAPEDIVVDVKTLFETALAPEGQPGLFISVYDGHIVMSNAGGELTLGKGEAGFVDPQTMVMVRLGVPPLFQLRDTIPSPQQLQKFLERFQSGLKPTVLQAGSQGDCQCEIVY